MFQIDLLSILPLTCALFVFFFGLFIFAKNPTSRIHQFLTAFCASMFFWMFGTFMMFGLRGTDAAAAIFWDRFVYVGVVFMPPLMHHFSLVFTKNAAQRKMLLINYILALFFLLVSRTNYFVDDLYLYWWGAHTKAQILHHIFLFYFFLGTGIFFLNLIRNYKNLKDREQRLQTLYVFLAFAVVIFIGGSAYLYAYGIDTKFPFAYFSGVVFPVLLFYAVTRHHLLGTKVIATEVLVGIALFVLITEMFLSNSIFELVLRAIIAIIIAIIGYLLIQSVSNEIKRRKQVTHLATSLEHANTRLRELDRQKTEFLSIASHQLRTPLSVIKGYLELIEDGVYGKPPKKLQKVLFEMDESNERLVQLIDSFLNISRIEQGRTKYTFADHDINELIGSVVQELSTRAEQKGLKFIWKPSKRIAHVYMDDEKIRHVIFNYLDNAIKYTDKGKIRVRIKKEKDGVAVRVIDPGLGFDKEDEDNLFNKFYRGKNVEGENVNGNGLGIYVCRQFAEAHGGYVWAHSPGLHMGSEFGFWIPNHRTKTHAKKEREHKPRRQKIVNQYDRERMLEEKLEAIVPS